MKLNRYPRIVFGSRYFHRYSALKKGALDNPDDEALLSFVNIAIKDIPYYQKTLKGTPIESLDDFESEVPFIDKDTVLANFADFLNPTLDISNYDHGTTGGTSGKPLKLIMPPDRYVVELATMHYLWSVVGYNFDVRAVIRNHKLCDNEIFTINPITKEVIFDGFRLNDEYFEQLYSVLKSQKIRFIHCYPSTAYEFSKYLVKENKDCSFIHAFLCGSENVVTYQRKFIENNLSILFFSFYGHSEKLVLGGFCSGNNRTNDEVDSFFEPSYGYYELIDEQGEVIKEAGILGEIVGTSLHNFGMPLIRYRTGDFALYKSMNGLDKYGRNLPVIGPIQGRWGGEKIYNKDDTFVTTTALNLHSDLYTKINGIQYLQKEKGILDVLIVKGDGYSEYDEKALYKHFESKMNLDTLITIRYVDNLIRKNNGKFLQLLSDLNVGSNIK